MGAVPLQTNSTTVRNGMFTLHLTIPIMRPSRRTAYACQLGIHVSLTIFVFLLILSLSSMHANPLGGEMPRMGGGFAQFCCGRCPQE